MRYPGILVGAAVLAASLLLAGRATGAAPLKQHRIGLIRRDNVTLRTGPSSHSRALAVLIQQTQVEVFGAQRDWTQVRVWASVKGWVQSADVIFRKPWETVSTYQPPEIHYAVRAHKPETVHARALTTGTVVLYRSPAGDPEGRLAAGVTTTVTSWQQDSHGQIWYRIGRFWAPEQSVRFLTPDPGLERLHGQPLWKRVSGKGMWLTLGTIADSAPDAIVRGAIGDGITHLYLEAAISPLGFHGRSTVAPLIQAAHKRGLAVIAWVYPYLYDLASDVALTREVAAFRTPSGDRFDGIAADLERNVSLSTVRAYSQLVRSYLGSGYLLVGVTYPPQSFPSFPFEETARQYNVIAPMDYWHQTKTAVGLDYGHMRYGYSYGYRYAADSVVAIRRVSGHVPVAPIGQTFDNFGRLEMGPHAPSAAEIAGFLRGSKNSGAVGASFFQWMTAAVGEWKAIKEFHY